MCILIMAYLGRHVKPYIVPFMACAKQSRRQQQLGLVGRLACLKKSAELQCIAGLTMLLTAQLADKMETFKAKVQGKASGLGGKVR